jgi:ABC-type polysaccharide/polyol phosphate export permease
LFAFSLVATSVGTGANSVVSSGRLLINTAFPRLLMPLAAVRTAFFRFLPTVPVYLVFHVIFLPGVWHASMILSVYFLGAMIVFSMGLAAFFATLQVYFRDTSNFLPYFVRLWMYISPVLWLPEAIDRLPRAVQTLITFQPMYSMLGGYTELIQEGTMPDLYMWLSSAAWAFGVATVGFLFFLSREREFAVRLN